MVTTGVAPSGLFKSFFPLSTNGVSIPSGVVPNTTDTGSAALPKDSRFTQISAHAVAGFSAYTDSYTTPTPNVDPKKKPTTQTITDTVVRYISRANGYVYEKRNDADPIQISNIYIPNIYEGSFMDNNQTALLRFLRDDGKTIATYAVPIPLKNPDGTRTQKEGRFFNDGINSLAVSPDQKEFLRIYPQKSSTELLISSSSDTNKKELINTPFSEWLPLWPTTNTPYLQTKASSSAEGFLYKIDRTERRLRRVLGNINGLTTIVSPSGTYILYSQSTTNSFQTILFNTKTNKTTPLSLKIIPEKCTWTLFEDLICAGNNVVADGIYPDGWYAGVLHFNDRLVRITTQTNTYEVLYDGTERQFDMTNLQYNALSNHIYFIDKNTGILWQYQL